MYYSDKPISSNTEDLIDRNNFSKMLAQSLVQLNTDETFTVGLFGKWGTGKTSIVNMVLQELSNLQEEQEEKTIIVRFDPWHFTDSTQLLSQFLLHLANNFRNKRDKKLSAIGTALEKYSGALSIAEAIPVAGKPIATISQQAVASVGKRINKNPIGMDILQQKEYATKLLAEQKNKILIVIDDIDRLSSKQIREVFQLVSSVAKFPNTIYLLVFDKEIVVKSLKSVQEGDGEDYLEKIIQIPIQIPEIPKSKLNSVLFKRLDSVISAYNSIRISKEHWDRIFAHCVEPFICNLRDINRLCNSLQFKITNISDEIDFGDMVAITAIEIKFPAIYEWIKSHKNILTGSAVWLESYHNKRTKDEWLKTYYDEFNLILEKSNGYSCDAGDINVIIDCLANLFSNFGVMIGKSYEVYDEKYLRTNSFISHPQKFDRYFNFDIDLIGIKRATIEKAVYADDVDCLVMKIAEEDSRGYGLEILEEIRAMAIDIKPERAEIIFRALIKSAIELKTVNHSQLFMTSAGAYAIHMSVELLNKVANDRKLICIMNILNEMDTRTANAIADFICTLEYAYGRFSENAEQYTKHQVISLSELEKLETVFVEKIKILLEHDNLFEFSEWIRVLYLLGKLDNQFTHTYLANAFVSNKNILYYLNYTVNEWTSGTANSYEITDDYSEYLTEKRIIDAIECEKETKSLFSLPRKTMYKCIAFYLHVQGNKNYRGYIDQHDIEQLLAKWDPLREHKR